LFKGRAGGLHDGPKTLHEHVRQVMLVARVIAKAEVHEPAIKAILGTVRRVEVRVNLLMAHTIIPLIFIKFKICKINVENGLCSISIRI
jgi:hypothetical protein